MIFHAIFDVHCNSVRVSVLWVGRAMICGLPPLIREFGVVMSLDRKQAWTERFIVS
jgi:hypothetical protein